MTVRENVAFGYIENIDNDVALNQALSMGFSDELTQRLDQNLGKLESDGIDLSGGQWQRLAIARACISDAQFYLLDEPTAALDPIAESVLYRNFSVLMKEKGSILVSHRLASATIADRILLIDGGIIVEEGSHRADAQKWVVCRYVPYAERMVYWS